MSRTGETIGWFRRPRGDDPGTLNVSYAALDRTVILGHGDDLVVADPTPISFAALLETVGALAGALAGFGVDPGHLVLLDLPDDGDAVTARLACARVGAVSVPTLDQLSDPVSGLAGVIDGVRPDLVISARHDLVAEALAGTTHRPAACVARGAAVLDRTRDVDWDTALQAGATDPAGCAAVPADAAYSLAWQEQGGASVPVVRTSGERAHEVAALVAHAPVPLEELRAALDR